MAQPAPKAPPEPGSGGGDEARRPAALTAARAPAPGEAPPPAASLPRCVGDSNWWEDEACICEEKWGPVPGAREADTSNPDI